MTNTQLRGILTMTTLFIVIEFIILMSLIYLAKLPLFLFLFTLILRLASFLLLGFIMMFLLFTMMGLKPELTLEWWIMHLTEYARSFFGALFLTCLLMASCVALGAAIALTAERAFLLPSMVALRDWAASSLR